MSLLPPAVPEEAPQEEVVVIDERADGAVDRLLDRADLESFPARSADEYLRALPGLHQSAHGGQGKAYQVFLRGFDAEHGTAIAVDVQGMPLNEVNNVHGHGYLDLHILPDLVVEEVRLHAGVPRARDGDFAVAGAASYRLGLTREGLFAKVGGGADRSVQAGMAWRPKDSLPGTFLVAQSTLGEGVGSSRGWRQLKAGAGTEHRTHIGRVRTTALVYDGRFESPGALREADLDDVGFYGSYPGSGGGESRRALLQLAAAPDRDGPVEAMVWGGWRELALQQNFTGFLLDGEQGDGSEQRMEALQGGGQVMARHDVSTTLGDLRGEVGGDLRVDRTDGTIAAIDADAEPVGLPTSARTMQTHPGGWAELRYRPTTWLSVEPGVRADAFHVQVDDEGSRQASATLASPRGRLVLWPASGVQLMASVGRGLQSPESRAVVAGARAPVTVSTIAEVGARVDLPHGLRLRGAAFRTDLDDELVFDHTVARYVSGGTTRRLGWTGVAEWTPVSALAVRSEATYADGRFVVTDTPIPFAPRWLTSHGVFLRQLSAGPALITAGLRAWTMGRRPLPSGFVSRRAVAADLTGQVEVQRWVFGVEVDNAFGNRWRDGEFVYASWWDRSQARSERPSLHVTAGEPLAVRLSLGYRFRDPGQKSLSRRP